MACSYPASAGLVWLADNLTSREGNPDMVNKYRKKPVVIEAIQFNASRGWDDVVALAAWCGGRPLRDETPANRHKTYYWSIAIPTLEGQMSATPGDWIIRGVQGEFYPCKSDIFAATYEQVEGDPTW